MARTHKDAALKSRIENLIKQFKDKTIKETIYLIAGICGISYRTASEHVYAFNAQKTLYESGFKEKCEHDWSNASSTPGGLCKECRLCGKTKFIELNNETP